jgi:hypothetical protein
VPKKIATKKLPFAPFQFRPEDTEQTVRVVTEEPDTVLGSLAVDGVALVKFDGLLAVHRKVDLVGNADNFDADVRLTGHDDRADGK